MFYGYHKALCLQRLKGDVFMDCCFLLHYLCRSKNIPLVFFLFFSSGPHCPTNNGCRTVLQSDKKETAKQSVQGTYF